MKLADRTLTVIIVGIGTALLLSWISRTDWGAARTVLDVSGGFEHPGEAILEVITSLLVVVPLTLLIQTAYETARPPQPRPGRPGPRSTGENGGRT